MANGDPIRIGQNGFGSLQTLLQATVNKPASTFRVQVGAGSTGDAIVGQADSGIGVVGVNTTSLRPGVWGTSSGGIFGAVFGSCPSMGVRGGGAIGVFGEGGFGVAGQSVGSSGVGVSGFVVDQFGVDNGSAGVLGHAEAGPGVDGAADSGAGVRGASSSGPGVAGRSDTGPGADAQSHSSAGVVGRSALGTGVHGVGDTTIGVTGNGPLCGVLGQATAGFGLYGIAKEGDGVRGESSGGWGVVGMAQSRPGVGARSQSAAGVDAGSATGPGVLAVGGSFGVTALASRGVGVRGETVSGAAGVHGVSARSVGVLGESPAVAGVVGKSGSGVGVTASAAGTMPALLAYGTGGGRAALFDGDVEVTGAFTVLGTKSAAVRHPDGTLRRLHCLEAPEALFEDIGEAELVDGSVEVRLDPDFAALIDAKSYHVFVTSYSRAALYVSRRDAEGFEIASIADDRSRLPDGPVRCSWRVVGRRADVAAERLAPFDATTRPDLRTIDAPQLPRPGSPVTLRLDAPEVPPAPAYEPTPAPPKVGPADPRELEV